MLGPRPTEDRAEQVRLTLAGVTGSGTTVTDAGLEVSAAAPIKGPRGLVGAICVGTTLDSAALQDVKDRDGVELAVFHDGRLAATTVADAGLADLLWSIGDPIGSGSADPAPVGAYPGYRPTARSFPSGSLLVLAPTGDLVRASHERTLTTLLGTGLALGGLLLLILHQAGAVVRPIEAVVSATEELARGNFAQRVAPGGIGELDRLGGAVNRLAEQLEVQRAELDRRAFYDPLTKLPNRALFADRVEHALARAQRLRL